MHMFVVVPVRPRTALQMLGVLVIAAAILVAVTRLSQGVNLPALPTTQATCPNWWGCPLPPFPHTGVER